MSHFVFLDDEPVTAEDREDEKTFIAIILLIFCYPVAVWYIWTKTKWELFSKVITTITCIFITGYLLSIIYKSIS